MKMSCEVRRQGDQTLFFLSGELFIEEAALLKKEFEKLPLAEVREMVFDLSGVKFLGSSAIGDFLLFFKRLTVHGGTMRLVAVPRALADLLYELKLNRLFPIEAHAEEQPRRRES